MEAVRIKTVTERKDRYASVASHQRRAKELERYNHSYILEQAGDEQTCVGNGRKRLSEV